MQVRPQAKHPVSRARGKRRKIHHRAKQCVSQHAQAIAWASWLPSSIVSFPTLSQIADLWLRPVLGAFLGLAPSDRIVGVSTVLLQHGQLRSCASSYWWSQRRCRRPVWYLSERRNGGASHYSLRLHKSRSGMHPMKGRRQRKRNLVWQSWMMN